MSGRKHLLLGIFVVVVIALLATWVPAQRAAQLSAVGIRQQTGAGGDPEQRLATDLLP